jgi:polyphosphate kinase
MEQQNLQQRDISWLSFNERVLQEAKDKSNPLLERIKFIAIYSSNLEEFFRVRVAQHQNFIRLGKKTQKDLEYNPKSTLDHIFELVNNQQKDLSALFETQIISNLKKNNINVLRRLELSEEQFEFIENYFQQNMLPYVQPVLLVKNKIRPFMANGEIYLAVRLRSKVGNFKTVEEYGLLNIPSDHLPRFIILPSVDPEKHDIIMLDDIVRHHVSWLFHGYEIVESFSIKLSRDADLYIDDEYKGDLVEKIKQSLNKRNVGYASRFVYDRKMPLRMLQFLVEMFQIDKTGMLPEGRYLNKADFFKFPDFGKNNLKFPPQPPLHYNDLENREKSIFETIKEKDHFLYYPYHSYKSVVRFFEQAAQDEQVTHIKVVQYRVAKKSKVIKSLIDAVNNGKKVSVFVEVKARFDEEANLQWGEILEQSGVEVHYSMPGIKVHSKMALIRRTEGEKSVDYTYLSTGNFNEDTAKVYTDYGLFTADSRLTSEISKVFTFLETGKKKHIDFEHILVGKFNLRNDLIKFIDKEISNAKAGHEAKIQLKMNSLQDHEMIEKLYQASRAGVKIQIIVRGLCCLTPQKRKISENIEVISIVDRYLEHARLFIFHNGGKPKYYISSADWMLRNLSYRVETTIPIYDHDIQQKLQIFYDIQWQDNTKARILDKDMLNEMRKTEQTEPINAQILAYEMVKKSLEE